MPHPPTALFSAARPISSRLESRLSATPILCAGFVMGCRYPHQTLTPITRAALRATPTIRQLREFDDRGNRIRTPSQWPELPVCDQVSSLCPLVGTQDRLISRLGSF